MRRSLIVGPWCLCALLIAHTAWAVVVTVNVENDSGDPVPGATITFQPSDPSQPPTMGTTDEDGRAVLDLPQGGYTATIRHGDSRTIQTPVTVGPDAVSIPFRLQRVPPTTGSAPFNLGVEFDTTSRHVDPTILRSTIRTLSNGQVVSEQTVDDEPGSDDSDEQRRMVAQVTFGPGARGNGSALLLRDPAWLGLVRPGSATGLGSPPAPQAPPGTASGGWRFYPAITGGVGRADVTFEAIDDDTGDRTTFEGDGLTWNLGAFGVLFPCATCDWFTGFGYSHTRVEEIDVTRNPPLEAPPGAVTARDDITYASKTHRIDLVVGHAFPYVAPFAGVRGTWHTVTAEGMGRLDAVNVPAAVEFEFLNEFERNTAEALFGADIRIPSTRLFIRLLGAANGDDRTFTAAAAYGWGL